MSVEQQIAKAEDVLVGYPKTRPHAHWLATLTVANYQAQRACKGLSDGLPCGFAWVTVPRRTPFVRAILEWINLEGFKFDGEGNLRRTCGALSTPEERNRALLSGLLGAPHHKRGQWCFWSPGKFRGQSMRAHLRGAEAFAAVLRTQGIGATVGCRLD